MEEKLLNIEKNISSLSKAQSSFINKMAAKPETLESTFATTHAIQVTIDENVRLLAQLHAKWKEKLKLLETIVCALSPPPIWMPLNHKKSLFLLPQRLNPMSL